MKFEIGQDYEQEFDFQREQDYYSSLVNDEFDKIIISTESKYDVVKDAMLYSLKAGGKRLRPLLVIEFCLANGGDIKKALPFACAVEMVHCYSLIHDDLPCMDNDDFRRGKPSCHKKYGDANALLAGDALLTLAFETLVAASAHCPPADVLAAIKVLANFSGIEGMIGGQVMDLINEGKKIDAAMLMDTHAKKTSALICAAVTLGCIAGGLSDPEAMKYAKVYGLELGFAFQIVDDILDVIGDSAVLGKPIGSDAESAKVTYPSLFGVLKSKKLAEHHTESALSALLQTPHNEFLRQLTVSMLNRVK